MGSCVRAIVRTWVIPLAVLILLANGPVAALDIFTSLEAPPSMEDIAKARAAGITIFDFDLDADGGPASALAVRRAGGIVSAYHVGGGGGRIWGSVKTGEFVRKYDNPADFEALSNDVRRLVGLGASYIHFDNTHRFSGKRLEAIADAIIAAGAGFIAKNNASKWELVMKRRPDLKPILALVEDAMFDADETQAAANLFARGVPVIIVGFKVSIDPKRPGVTDDYARAYAMANPWARVLLMEDEKAFDSRMGYYITPP